MKNVFCTFVGIPSDVSSIDDIDWSTAFGNGIGNMSSNSSLLIRIHNNPSTGPSYIQIVVESTSYICTIDDAFATDSPLSVYAMGMVGDSGYLMSSLDFQMCSDYWDLTTDWCENEEEESISGRYITDDNEWTNTLLYNYTSSIHGLFNLTEINSIEFAPVVSHEMITVSMVLYWRSNSSYDDDDDDHDHSDDTPSPTQSYYDYNNTGYYDDYNGTYSYDDDEYNKSYGYNGSYNHDNNETHYFHVIIDGQQHNIIIPDDNNCTFDDNGNEDTVEVYWKEGNDGFCVTDVIIEQMTDKSSITISILTEVYYYNWTAKGNESDFDEISKTSHYAWGFSDVCIKQTHVVTDNPTPYPTAYPTVYGDDCTVYKTRYSDWDLIYDEEETEMTAYGLDYIEFASNSSSESGTESHWLLAIETPISFSNSTSYSHWLNVMLYANWTKYEDGNRPILFSVLSEGVYVLCMYVYMNVC